MIHTRHNWKSYLLVRKDQSLFMRLLSIFVPGFMDRIWTTWRWPLQKQVKIYYPVDVKNPLMPAYEGILNHEEVHCRDFQKLGAPIWIAFLYLVFPLPIFCSGRWWVERRAFLTDIRNNRNVLDEAVKQLWRFYLCPWPRSSMKKWFEKELERE